MKIICLDDHPTILEGLVRKVNISAPDAMVFAFQDATTAVECALESGCDVLFCEIKLANGDGLLCAEKIREINPRVNIVFATVCEEGERAKEVMRLHPSGYVTKPYTLEQIAAELNNLRYPANEECVPLNQNPVSVSSLYRSPVAAVASKPTSTPNPKPEPTVSQIPVGAAKPTPIFAPEPAPASQKHQNPGFVKQDEVIEEKAHPMDDRDLRRLSRAELLDMLIKQTKENEKLKTQLRETERKLESKVLTIEKAGSIAQAAMQLNGVFEAAQQAANQYLENVRTQSEQQIATYARREQEYNERAEQILADARTQCTALERETARKCEEMTRTAEAEAQVRWNELHEKMETYLNQHEQLRTLMAMYK